MTNQAPIVKFAPGESLFKEGERGDFIFHIESGTVEIFVGQGHGIVVLTEMNSGEVVGVMAAVTGQPRLASARAKTEVVAKKLPSKAFTDQIKNLPDWIKAVFKDYRARLDHINKLYTEQSHELRKLHKTINASANIKPPDVAEKK